MQNWIKRSAGLGAVALDRLQPQQGRNAVGVLTYHRTAPVTAVDRDDELNVAPEVFRQQLLGLVERGFTFVAVADLVAWHQGEAELPPRPVAVTFDDGYACTALVAEPIMADLGIPATMFVSTAFLDLDGPFPIDGFKDRYGPGVPVEHYRPLSAVELEKVIANGVITVGAHSHTHDNFAARPERFGYDVEQNMTILREDFGLADIPFAFPYGVVRRRFAGGDLSRQLPELGVTCGFSTEPTEIDRTSDRYCLGRFTAYPWDTPATLQAKLNGRFTPLVHVLTKLSG